MLTTVTPELDFVLAAVRGDAGAARARVQAAARVTDWNLVPTLAVQHDVAWFVRRALPERGVPDEARRRLGDAVRVMAASALAAATELVALVRALEGAGVGVVAYKGPALAADVHGDVAARCFTDLDLLIAERERSAARRALLAIGYQPPAGYTEREERFYSAWEGVSHVARAGAGWPVEVHWRCQAPRYGAPQDPAPIVAQARRCAVGGGAVPVPAPEPLAVLLALHGVKHGWTSLLWVVDFANSVMRPGFDWTRFDGVARGWGVTRAVNDALLVARELAALEVPAARLEEAQRDARAARLARAAVLGLLGDAGAEDVGASSTPRYDLEWIDGCWARIRYLALAAALPTPQERRVVRLPDALLPLAYPVRAWRLWQHARGRRA